MDIHNLPILDYKTLCKHLNIDPMLHGWRERVGLNPKVFDAIFLAAFREYAEMVQLAPASQSHHHSGPGGLLTHTHEVISIGLQKRAGLKLPLGASIAEIEHKQHLWSYGVFAACLLHDAGKLLTTTRLQLNYKDDQKKYWSPHDKSLAELKRDGVTGYSIEFEKVPYKLHTQVAPTLFGILPRMARAWISEEPLLMGQLCAHISGDRFESGVIGEIAESADMESTRLNLQLPAPAQRFSNQIPLIDRYMGFIRGWLYDNKLKLNKNGAMGFCSQDGHLYFVCRTLADMLIEECKRLNITDVPSDQVRVYDTLQEYGYALSTDDGKAIHTMTIAGKDYRHVFTCLKMEARRLSPPTRNIPIFEGDILVGKVSEAETKVTSKPAEKKSTKTTETDINKHEIQESQTIESQIGGEEKQESENTHTMESAQESKDAPALEKITESSDNSESPETEEKPMAAEEKPSLVFGIAKKIRHQQDSVLSADKTNDTEIDTEIDTEENTVEAAENKDNDDSDELIISDTVEIETEKAAPKLEDVFALKVVKTHEGMEADEKTVTRDNTTPAHEPMDPRETRMFDNLSSEDDDLHRRFLEWICTSIRLKRFRVNEAKAFVHFVEKGIFLASPIVIQKFIAVHELPEKNEKGKPLIGVIGNKFDRLRKHIPNNRIPGKSLNIHPYWVRSKKKNVKLNGRLLPYSLVFGDDMPLPEINKVLTDKQPYE